jgi:hypothetical protein
VKETLGAMPAREKWEEIVAKNRNKKMIARTFGTVYGKVSVMAVNYS